MEEGSFFIRVEDSCGSAVILKLQALLKRQSLNSGFPGPLEGPHFNGCLLSREPGVMMSVIVRTHALHRRWQGIWIGLPDKQWKQDETNK